MLTTLLILTNKNKSKQHTECIQPFYISHKFPCINISSTVQWSTILQLSSSKIRHYLEHSVELFHIKIMVHLQRVFQSLDKFYPSAPETNLSLQFFFADPHLYSSITNSSLLLAKWDYDEAQSYKGDFNTAAYVKNREGKNPITSHI